MFKRIFITLTFIAAFVLNSHAQNITNYSFAATSGTFTVLSGGTTPGGSGTLDEGYSNTIPIGFDFWYMGIRYTTLSVSTNGWLTLGANINNATNVNSLSSGGAPRPIIAPLWDDLSIQAAGNNNYLTTGSAGSRIFTFESLNCKWNSLASGNTISYQVKLYEATGKIQFVYRSETGSVNSGSASIGIGAILTGSGNFLSLNGTGTAPTASSTAETSTLSTKPASGQTYSFTPPVPAAPTVLNYTSVFYNAMTLNWTDNSANEVGFAIYRSTDGVNYSFVTQTAANITTLYQSGLSGSTTYYWKVYAITEGALSSVLSGSQVTPCTPPMISQIPTTNLIANYIFSGNANDVTGNNNGTLQNAPSQSADRFGIASKSYTLNGTTQYVSTTNTYSNPVNFTVSIWFKTNTTTGGKLIGFGKSQTGSSGQYDRHIYMNNAGQIYFGVYPGSVVTVNSALSYNDNNWHLATATLSSTLGMALYVDGTQVGSNSGTTTAENYTGYWRIGFDNNNGWTSQPTSFYFNGTLDDALIYDRAITASEVATLYNSPDGAGNNGPVCSGATLSLSATTAGGATYSWTGPNSFSSSSQNPSFAYSTAKAGVYTLQVTAAGCTATAYTNVQSSTATGQWTGNTSTDWADANNWCNGVVPGSTTNVIITSTATRMPSIISSVSCNNLTINSGATLTTSAAGTLNIAGTLTNNGTMTNSGTTSFNGSSGQQTFTGVASFYNLTITNSTGLLVPAAITIDNNLLISAGTLVSNLNIIVKGNWTNNSSASAFTAGTATVTFSGATAQIIGGSFATTFNNLIVANTATSVTLNVNTSITSDLTISSNIFDIAGFTANRATSGGILTVSNNATLRIGGTNTYPANYTTNTLVVASTIEYSGTNQTVSNQAYGNLALSSSSGAAVKTLPATAFSVLGNLTSTLGAGTSVSFTAASNITVGGSVSVGASTTFSGGTFSHTIGGNWSNSGTFTGNTSTVIFNGAGAVVSGSGTQNFNNLTLANSGITFSSGSITLTGNLATTGSGSFVQASGGTFIMSGTGKTISGSSISICNLTVSGSITTAISLTLTGNLSVSGSFSATSGTIAMSGTSKTISGGGTISFNTFDPSGSIIAGTSFSIATSLVVDGSFSETAGTATFTGTSSLSGTANLYSVVINGTSLQLAAGSILGIANTLTVTSGTLNVSTSGPNTVNFNGTVAQSVNAITYSNLILSNGNTKTALGSIVTLFNITIGTSTTFNLSTYTSSVYGNWINNGTFSAGTSTVQFLGPATAYITGATTFNILTSNTSSASTQLVLQSHTTAAIVNMTLGIMETGSDTITITNTRTGNGFIYGNIQRIHPFTTGVAYAFEGPDNIITFSSVTSVSSIMVSVNKGSIGDFPFGGSISRVYNITVPAGTYNATLRLHYEDAELNGNSESSMALWNYITSTWTNIGKTANSTSTNYVEQSGLTNITNRWTCSDNANLVQWNGSVSTDWNTAANWTVIQGSGSRPPTSADIVDLGTATFTNQPTISNAVTVKNIIFGSVKAVTLTLGSGGSLITTGDINGTWSSNATHTINTNNQALTINGNLSLSDGTSNHKIDLNIGTGTTTVMGSITESGGSNITFSGAGNLNIFQNFTYTSGTFTPGTGTVSYNGTANQNISSVNYNNLTIDKSAALAAINNVTSIAGNLLIIAGQLDNYSTAIIAGNVTINAGSAVNNHVILHVGGNWNNNGTYTATGASIFFDGTGTQNISASTFNNLNINKASGTAYLTGDVVITGDLTISSGTFDIQTYNFDRNLPGGTATTVDGATFMIGADNPPRNFTNNIIGASSTTIFYGTTPQFIGLAGITFGNLIFRGTGAKTVLEAMTVNGDLTIESSSSLNVTSATVTLNGNWINNGTFIPGTSTVLFNGTTKTLTGVTTFNKATAAGSYTFLDNMAFNDLLNITSTGSLSAGSTILTTMNGDLINSGVLYTLGTTTFTGNVVQTLSLINAIQTVAITVNFNGTVSPVLNSTSTPQFGFLNINNTGGINPSVGYTVLYALTVGSGASFNGGVSTHNIFGTLTNNGIITSTGTFNFIPSTAKTLNFGSNFSSTGLVNFGGTGAITVSGAPTSFYRVLISNTNAVGIAPASNWLITDNFAVNSGSVFNAGSYTHSIGGDILNSGTITPSTSTFILNGTGTQNITTSSAFDNLTMNKASGSTTLSSNVTVNGVLNFVVGKIQTGIYSVIQPSTGTVTGAAQSAGWVFGNLRKNFGTGAVSKTFEIGDGSSYTPLTTAFANVTTSGDLTAFTTAGDHPNISSSVINAAKSLNRFWTLANSGISFTNYSAIYNFISSDIDAGASTTAFNVATYNGSSWTLPVTASPNSTNIQATGITSFGDFAVGEICNIGTAISYTGSPYCNNSGTASVTLTGSGGGTFSADPGLSLNTSTGAINLGASVLGTYTVTYTIAASGSCGQYITSALISIVAPGTWSGDVSTAWNTSGNWLCGIIPTSSTNVIIPSGLTNYPILNSGTALVKDITIEVGAKLTVTGAILQITGDIKNNGTFTASSGTIEFNGSSMQTIPASAFTGNKIMNFIISNDVLLTGQDSLTGTLSFGNVNSKTFTTGGYLTLKSNATNTAVVGDITNNNVNTGNTISGDVNVERYLSSLSNRAYRLLGPSVNTATSIHANWQEGATSYGNNPTPGYGTHITGTTVDQTNGFDATTTGQKSLYTFNQGTSAWVAAPNTNSAVFNGLTGYLLYIRGDRSIDLSSQATTLPSTNTTLRATGSLLTGTQTFSSLAGNNKFSLVTNPFASAINWTTVQAASSGITNSYTLWDPNYGTRGGYVTVNTSGVASSGVATQNIQSGQAFFVQASGAASPTVSIRETDKTSTNNIDVFSVPYARQTFSTSLYFMQADGSPRIADGVVAVYNDTYSALVDGDDAEEINNWDENIAIAREGKHLSIESRPAITGNDTLALFMNNMKAKDYSFVFVPSNLNLAGTTAELVDNFTTTRTAISLTDTTTIGFTISGAAGSNASDRFYIVFKPLKVLPVTITSVKASQQSANVTVDWKVENELNIKQYEVERSFSGTNFTKMAIVIARNASDYNWLDADPATGNNFYRIKIIDADGHSNYSNVIKVNILTGKQLIIIYPNPIQNGIISLSMENMPKGIYNLKIVNNLGQVLMQKSLSHNEGSGTEIIALEKNISSGTYLLEIIKPDNITITNKIYFK